MGLLISKNIVNWMKVLDAGKDNWDAFTTIMEALGLRHLMPISRLD
jgi:hypothetical protein